MPDRPAVIFDIDGVLIDSYEAHFRAWREVAERHGYPEVTETAFATTFGQTSREVLAQWWPEIGVPQVKALDEEKEALFRDLIATDSPIMPGALALIDALVEDGFLLGAGSSAPPDNVHMIVDQLGIRDMLGAMITGADVRRGKPDPEVFLLAAERLSVEPRRCIVVEDAEPGVAAAVAAGMASVGFASTGRHREDLHQAKLVIDRLDELSPRILRELLPPAV
ncbi:MAG: HAD family hydrolase [Pirellulales bacterium]